MTVRVQLPKELAEAAEAPGDNPHTEMMREAVNTGLEILRACGIPAEAQSQDDRLPKTWSDHISSFRVGITPHGPGEGCEPLLYGWTWEPRGWDVVDDGENSKLVRNRPSVWRGHQYTKTEYATDYHLTHGAVCRVFEDWLKRELLESVHDDAGWHPRHNVSRMLTRYPGASDAALQLMQQKTPTR